MKAKPICVVSVPFYLKEDTLFSWSDAREMAKSFEESMPDYYWFVIPKEDAKTVEFEVFYEKNFTEIQYAELKKIITDSIK